MYWVCDEPSPPLHTPPLRFGVGEKEDGKERERGKEKVGGRVGTEKKRQERLRKEREGKKRNYKAYINTYYHHS